MKPGCAKFDFGKCDETGAVPDFVDFTTDEYSFVIKCTASRHLPVWRKNSSALQGRWLEEPEGFPTHVSFRKGNKRVVTPLRMANKNGHYGRREGNKRALWPPQGEQKGRYAPVGVRPPRPFGARPPARWDSSFHRNRDADFRIHKPVRAYTRQALVRARMWKTFFGLKILILN